MIEDVLKKHKEECELRINEMEEHIGRDKCSNYEEVKKMTGKIRGVRMSLEILEDLTKRYYNDDEDEDDEQQ